MRPSTSPQQKPIITTYMPPTPCATLWPTLASCNLPALLPLHRPPPAPSVSYSCSLIWSVLQPLAIIHVQRQTSSNSWKMAGALCPPTGEALHPPPISPNHSRSRFRRAPHRANEERRQPAEAGHHGAPDTPDPAVCHREKHFAAMPSPSLRRFIGPCSRWTRAAFLRFWSGHGWARVVAEVDFFCPVRPEDVDTKDATVLMINLNLWHALLT
jgi:hypothetical protein